MKINQRDKKILAACQVLGDDSIATIARASGVRDHIARRVLQNALESGAMTRRVIINCFDLGLHQYALIFSIAARSAQKRAQAKDILMKAPFVELLLELSGEHDFLAVLTVRNAFDIENLLHALGSRGDFSMFHIQMHARTGWHYHGAKYLSQAPAIPTLTIAPAKKQHQLSLDESLLLQAYAKHPTGNLSDVARKLGRALSSVQYQIERWKETGLILGTRYQIRPEAVECRPFRALVTTNSPQISHRKAIMEWARVHPNVVSSMWGLGSWQYEFRIEIESYDGARSLVDELIEDYPDMISEAKVLTVVRVLKMELMPDISLIVTKKVAPA